MVKGVKTVSDFIYAFANNKLQSTDRHGFWSMVNYGGIDTLEFKTDRIDLNRYWDSDNHTYVTTKKPVQDKPEKIAVRLPSGDILVNANTLQFAVRYSYGHATNNQWRNEGMTDQQRELRDRYGAVPIPFTLFDETGLDPSDFRWIVKPVPETVIIKTGKIIQNADHPDGIPETRSRHFTGGCIFAIGDQYYLFDVDRQELDHNIFNAFITALKAPAITMQEAYDQLMPDEVKAAIAAGKDVKRQGEFFFIKYGDEHPVKADLTPEEKQILMYKPTRFGFGLSDTPGYGDGEKFPDYQVRDMPVHQQEKLPAYHEAVKKYRDVLDKVTGLTANRGSLGKSASGSHSVEKYIKDPVSGIVYVSGKVSQSRREHHEIILEGWYTVSPNTAVISWTITGNID